MSTLPETFPAGPGPEVQKKEPDSDKPNWFRSFFGSLLQRFSAGQSRQAAIEAKKEKLVAEIEQIDIEELCSLSPEVFLESPQFFKLFKLYNLLFHVENPILVERLQNSTFAGFVVDGILTMFINLRSLLTNDLQRARDIDKFRNRVLKYLDDKGKEEEIREEVIPRNGDALVGIPDAIRRFDVLGIKLSYDDTYKDWCVFPRPTATASVVSREYGRRLNSLTRKEMSLMEGAIRFNIFNRDQIVSALMNGAPAFDYLMEHIRRNLPKQ